MQGAVLARKALIAIGRADIKIIDDLKPSVIQEGYKQLIVKQPNVSMIQQSLVRVVPLSKSQLGADVAMRHIRCADDHPSIMLSSKLGAITGRSLKSLRSA